MLTSKALSRTGVVSSEILQDLSRVKGRWERWAKRRGASSKRWQGIRLSNAKLPEWGQTPREERAAPPEGRNGLKLPPRTMHPEPRCLVAITLSWCKDYQEGCATCPSSSVVTVHAVLTWNSTFSALSVSRQTKALGVGLFWHFWVVSFLVGFFLHADFI